MKKTSNINKLSKKDAEKLSQDIGEQVRKISDQACEDANEILNKYGMIAKMQIVIEEAPSSKKHSRPKKDTQSLT